mmetsp:Transcript_24744/g.79671  ORF Transcript_24744/g.79671 Transcript_24744/m.79671 type:complete len:218 (+) Transcript_24744:4253-4906(+)
MCTLRSSEQHGPCELPRSAVGSGPPLRCRGEALRGRGRHPGALEYAIGHPCVGADVPALSCSLHRRCPGRRHPNPPPRFLLLSAVHPHRVAAHLHPIERAPHPSHATALAPPQCSQPRRAVPARDRETRTHLAVAARTPSPKPSPSLPHACLFPPSDGLTCAAVDARRRGGPERPVARAQRACPPDHGGHLLRRRHEPHQPQHQHHQAQHDEGKRWK